MSFGLKTEGREELNLENVKVPHRGKGVTGVTKLKRKKQNQSSFTYAGQPMIIFCSEGESITYSIILASLADI